MIKESIINYSYKKSTTDKGTIILLHGLFGNLSNWDHVMKKFSKQFNILSPEIPLNFSVKGKDRLNSLVEYLNDIIEKEDLNKVTLVGNSLGGHIALLYTLQYPDKVDKLILTGSSGLFENGYFGSFLRIKDSNYIKEKIKLTFYNKELATNSLIENIYQKIQNQATVLTIIGIAKNAQRSNLANHLRLIKVPTLLIWGLQDKITPISVAYEFYEKIPNARLHILNQCGHVPMMEQPLLFNEYLEEFLMI